MKVPGYDIIGDIHARYKTLLKLLTKLDYHKDDKCFRHKDGRKLIFLGDLPDRGNEHHETFSLIRDMVEQEQAIVLMGNHELFAIRFSFPSLRKKIIKNCIKNGVNLHGTFQKAYPIDSETYVKLINWFKKFPIFIESQDGIFRGIHACWDDDSIALLKKTLRKELNDEAGLISYFLDEKSIIKYAYENGAFTRAIDMCLKGPEVEVPPGYLYINNRMQRKTRARIKWWKASFQDSEWIEGSWYQTLKLKDRLMINRKLNLLFEGSGLSDNYRGFTFIGHYFINKPPSLLTDQICCLDFAGGITAYRLDKGCTKLFPKQLIFQLEV